MYGVTIGEDMQLKRDTCLQTRCTEYLYDVARHVLEVARLLLFVDEDVARHTTDVLPAGEDIQQPPQPHVHTNTASQQNRQTDRHTLLYFTGLLCS